MGSDGGPLQRLIRELADLPGVGEKSAERMAFHLLSLPKEEALRLSDALRDVKEGQHDCRVCCNEADGDPCRICRDAGRDRTVLCVVEQSSDLWALEKTSRFRGVYHVLKGRLSPLDGVGPERLTVARLADRVRENGLREIILATNPTLEGDSTALYLKELMAPADVRVTRLARGLPSGGSVGFANRAVLSDAIDGRQAL